MAAEIPNGAFIVARAIFNSSLWTMRDKDRILGVTLIGIANHSPQPWSDGQNNLTIGRGQLIRTLQGLSEAAKMSIQNIRTSLRHLEKAGFLTRVSTSRYTLITLPKYDFYQDLSNYSDSANTTSNKQLTRDQHASNKRPTLNNNDTKNVKKGKKGRRKRGDASADDLDARIQAQQLHPDYGDFPIRMAKLWNKHGFGHRINETSGSHQVVMALENSTKKKAIEELLYDKDRCRGKKIWEALESVIPKGRNGSSAAQRFLERTGEQR